MQSVQGCAVHSIVWLQVDELFRELYGDTTARHDQLLEGAEALVNPAQGVGAAGNGINTEPRASATAQTPAQVDRGAADAGEATVPIANVIDGAVRKGLSARLNPAAEGAPGAVSESLAQNGVLHSELLSVLSVECFHTHAQFFICTFADASLCQFHNLGLARFRSLPCSRS